MLWGPILLDWCSVFSNGRDAAGCFVFEDVPLPLFLKFVEGAESFRHVLGLFLAELDFNFVLLDSDDGPGA